MYQKLDITTTYNHSIGQTIYDFVLKNKPAKVVEWGIKFGFSTVSIALALKELGHGHVFAYDWFRTISAETAKNNIRKYGVEEFVTVEKQDFLQWMGGDIESFDLLHIDIHNDGCLLRLLQDKLLLGSRIIFEGGSEGRDKVDWMIKRKCIPMNKVGGYKILNEEFPSISLMVTK